MGPLRDAIIEENEQLAPGVTQLTLRLSDSTFAFSPGQTVTLHLDELRRTYSIASAPERPSALQLCIRLGSGEGSEAVRRLRPGDTVGVEGPGGAFIAPRAERPLVLIAGDTGLAPVRSIVLHLLATGDGRAITVLYEPQGEELFAGDFQPLADAGSIVYATGEIERLIGTRASELSEAAIMVAGFEPFLDRAAKALTAAGVSPENVLVETYGP